jgi:HK97 family phage portal protein
MLQRLRNLFSAKGQLASPPPALLEALGVTWSSTASGVAVSPEVALRCPAVSCAVRAIAEAVACLPVSVYRVGADGSREEATDHPVHALLAGQWNDWTGAYDGVHAGTVDALTNDAGGLIFVNRVNGAPRELIRLKPGAWSVDRDLATDEPTFRSADRVLPLADCINVRAFGSTNRAPLTLAREAIAVALLMEQHAAKLFARGARPSGVLKLASKISEAALARIRKSWSDTHGGSENSGRTAILEEGAEWQALSFNSVDSQFIELRQFQILEIARAFRVPPHMLFDLGRATWSNVESLGREFLVFCLQPMLRAWESALKRALLSPEERREYVIEFSEDDLTQASIADRAVAYSSLISSRVINPNEARKWERLPPYKDGEAFINPNVTAGAPAEQGAQR